jgi:ligand-binding SRPBCC domain-containing protein
MATLDIETLIEAPVEQCFDLARSIELHVQSMKGSGERAIAGVTSGLIGFGQELTWAARHFGIKQRFTSRMTAFEPPVYFQDTMVRGAFSSFVHDHYFHSNAGNTIMRDRVRFHSPGWIFGALIDRLILSRYLQQLLRSRGGTIKQAAEQRNESQ